ncbi:MAG: DinB family protein [Acidobacteria bacterium]|nr:DinB family protein [Acidobacteriota bacterium]
MELSQTFALLSATPATLNALLRNLPEVWTQSNEGSDSWNAIEIVGHLIQYDHNNSMRLEWILKEGDSKPFPKFDRTSFQTAVHAKSLADVLDEFTQVRTNNLEKLQKMDLSDVVLAKRGIHPALGSVTLGQLLATWAAHDLTHLHQLTRVLAYAYRDAVGPWSAFLGVLQCNGHSKPA